MVMCPTCDRDDFDTERALKIHHSKAHGESISGVELSCEYCGDTYRKPPSEAERSRFCSRECMAAHRSETMTTPFGGERNGVELECEWCGTTYRVPASSAERGSRFCSRDCQASSQSVEFSDESWHMYGVRGADHPSYTGHDNYYGENWPEQRTAALDRDGRKCVVCSMSMEEHLDEHGCELHVHHVQPIATYESPEDANELDNLITLCRACHVRWEGIPLLPEVVRDADGTGSG